MHDYSRKKKGWEEAQEEIGTRKKILQITKNLTQGAKEVEESLTKMMRELLEDSFDAYKEVREKNER